MGDANLKVLVVPEHICWVQDANQILIVDERAKHTYSLQGIEAVLWSWLSCDYKFEKIMAMLAVLLNINREDTERFSSDVLKKWLESGILEMVQEHSVG